MSLRERFPDYFVDYEPDPALLETDDEPASSFLRKAMFEALRKFEPDASLDGLANIRILGSRYDSGVFDELAADIFQRIQKEVEAAAPEVPAESLRMAIASIGEGSLVLNLAPFPADVPPGEQIPASGPSHLENALIRVLELHDTVEHNRQIESAASPSGDLVNRLRQLVDALDAADAGLEIDVSRWNGDRRRSRLTAAGRTNAHHILARVAQVETMLLSGVLASVTVEAEFAKVQLQQGRRKPEILEVPAALAKQLPWDQQLRIEVRAVTQADRFGEQSKTKYEFLRMIGHDEPMPD